MTRILAILVLLLFIPLQAFSQFEDTIPVPGETPAPTATEEVETSESIIEEGQDSEIPAYGGSGEMEGVDAGVIAADELQANGMSEIPPPSYYPPAEELLAPADEMEADDLSELLPPSYYPPDEELLAAEALCDGADYLVQQLDNDDFDLRQAASEQLFQFLNENPFCCAAGNTNYEWISDYEKPDHLSYEQWYRLNNLRDRLVEQRIMALESMEAPGPDCFSFRGLVNICASRLEYFNDDISFSQEAFDVVFRATVYAEWNDLNVTETVLEACGAQDILN